MVPLQRSAAAILSGAVLVLALWLGARTAGGADAFGYVSQAYLWRSGTLHVTRPLIADVPWRLAAESAAPLGYRPGGGTTIVPTYAPGAPLLMAALTWLGGACGPYWLSPLMAAAAIFATWTLGTRLTASPQTALLSAFFLASSPVFLFHSMLPMSDVATTALWALSMCALTVRGAAAAGVAGVCAGIAILVRPNLVPLAVAGVAACHAWPERHTWRAFRRRAAAYLLCGVVPGAAAIAVVNDRLYGSPLLSGYGESGLLYSLSYFATNVLSFGRYLVGLEGAVLVPAAVLWWGRRRSLLHATALPAVVFCAGVFLSYLFYQPQNGWIFLRFLLPAFPLLFIASAEGWRTASARWPRGWQRPATLVLLALCLLRGAPVASRIFTVGAGEDRFAAVASFVARVLPSNALVVASQHSGTVLFYAGRPTIRYEWLRPWELRDGLDWLSARGYRPYLVLDNWEEPQFRQRFGNDTAIGRLELRVVGEYRGGVDVRVFDLQQESPDPGRPFPIVAHRACAAPPPSWPTSVK